MTNSALHFESGPVSDVAAASRAAAGGADGEVDDEALPTHSAALQKLFERLQRQPNFPALQTAVRGVQRVVRNGTARLQNLAAVVLGDPAITHRMLRLSNAAYYRGVGGGSISSIERAIALMGFDAVQQMAVCAHLLDGLPRDGVGLALREDYLRALLAARLAQTLCLQPTRADEAYITALYQNLGRMVVSVHLGAEAVAIRSATPHAQWPISAAEQSLSQQHLGVSYARLGAQLARRWGWPEPLHQAMSYADWPAHARPNHGPARSELRWLGRAANELADLMLYQAPDRWPAACQQLAALAAPSTGQTTQALIAALAQARGQLEELAASVGLSVSQLPQWQRVEANAHADTSAAGSKPAAVAAVALSDDALLASFALPPPKSALKAAAAPEDAPACRAAEAMPRPEPVAEAVAEPAAPTQPSPAALLWLAEHSRVLSEALLRDDAHHAVPREALRMLWTALGARRAVLHLNAPDGLGFLPVQALGEPMADSQGKAWRVDPEQGRDLFSRLCAAATDSLIEDAHRPKIARYLPPAFLQRINARRFLVLPIVARGRPLGMIYLDRADDEPFIIDDSAMQLVRTVRNQAAVALV